MSMKAYSQDLRQRILRAIDAGKTQAEVAATFAVSTATIKRYLKARRESGQVEPKAIPGRPAVKGAVWQAHLLEQLEAHPDVRREEHCRLFCPGAWHHRREKTQDNQEVGENSHDGTQTCYPFYNRH